VSRPTGTGGPLLRTKLLVPAVPAGHVPRPRLTARLDAAEDVPVTAVTAGAGWGKSTLLAAWARGRTDGSLAWVSLDAGDDDPGRFWTYLATALAAVAPAAADPALRALAVPSVDPLEVAVPELLNGLLGAPDRVVLVLDDLHELTDPRVTEGLEFLLDHQPPALRVVLAARAEPPVGMARLRARGRLAELTVDDLRFTAAEADLLLAGLGAADRTNGELAAAARLLRSTLAPRRPAQRPAPPAAGRLDNLSARQLLGVIGAASRRRLPGRR